jgi:hypothetical protein
MTRGIYSRRIVPKAWVFTVGCFLFVPMSSAGTIDPCLVGTWVATTSSPLDSRWWPGGDGFRVTFHADGVQSLDYTDMKPFESKGPGYHVGATFRGMARGRITTANNRAKIEKIEQADVTGRLWVSPTDPKPAIKLKDLGPGALGGNNGENQYACSPDALEYQITIYGLPAHAGTPTHSVKLTRVDQGRHGMAGRYPEEGP